MSFLVDPGLALAFAVCATETAIPTIVRTPEWEYGRWMSRVK